MRRRSTEVNVFSMSALDLFASALGAFILITVVLFPFFPNTGDSQERIDQVREELKEKRKEVEELKKQADGLKQDLAKERNAPKLQFPHLDLVIALDTTGSMRDEVDGLKNEIGQLVDLLGRLSPSLGFAVVDFKDRCFTNRGIRSLPLREMSPGNFSQLRSFINSMQVGGDTCNSDGPEALYGALQTSIDMNWRATSEVRAIIIITDNPPYPEEVQPSLNLARSFASRAGDHRVSGVFAGNGPGRSYLQQLSSAGNGQFVDAGGSMTAAVLLALANR